MIGLGYAVSLSADGSRLAVGSVGSRYSTYTRNNNGYWSTQWFTVRLVRVYQEPGSELGEWSKLGNTLDAAAGGSMSSQNYDLEFGSSVSLSDDGSTLAIAGWKGYNATVHRYDSDQNAWLQVGNVIRLKERWECMYWYEEGCRFTGDPIGPSIALSGDSKRVMVGGYAAYTVSGRNFPPRFVGVYEMDYGTGNWTLMGDFISEVRTDSRFGHSVALSHDGTRIAIGDRKQGSQGATRVYVWTSGSWRTAINILYGSQYAGASVSLSGDGTRLVIGDQPLGKISIHHLPVDFESEDEESSESEGEENSELDKNKTKPPAGNSPPKKSPSGNGASGGGGGGGQVAGEKKKQAEKTRDAILGDIKDARLKKKAKLLADAAIAGVKVQRLTAKLTAADEDTACSTAFTKAGMSSSDGACVATVASSGKRRRLSATAYDVELMFSSSTVSDDALTAAANVTVAVAKAIVDAVTVAAPPPPPPTPSPVASEHPESLTF